MSYSIEPYHVNYETDALQRVYVLSLAALNPMAVAIFYFFTYHS